MAILSKLLEKKDVDIYIDLRIKHLLSKDIKSIPAEYRENFAKRREGRIAELTKLKSLINGGKLKEWSKRYWKEQNEVKKSEEKNSTKLIRNHDDI